MGRWGRRFILLFTLLVGIIILLGVSGHLSLFSPWLEIRSINLTGKNASGQIEVPVLNLWARPGFVPDNQIQARVSLIPTGEVKAQLLAREEVQGLSWYKVKVKEGRGWVFARFVVE